MPNGPCLLCGVESVLQLSHILPAFAFRWLRDSSGSQHIRSSVEPNQRIQDGEKRYWLCLTCEGLFSSSESEFANRLFYPYLASPRSAFRYSHWLLRFCCSVSWRVLRYYAEPNSLEGWKQDQVRQANAAESVWREFLLGKRNHPGAHRQLLIPMDHITNDAGGLVPNINRYLMRAVHMDLCHSDKSAFTYAKLGRFVIVGLIQEPRMDLWRGSKVHATEGVVEPREYVISKAFLDYLNEKARAISTALGSVSERQQAKIDDAIRSNAERIVSSDAFTALQADVELFGSDAFRKPTHRDTDPS